MTTTRIDLIRHGEPEGGNVFRGRINPPLTANGRWQVGERLRRFPARWQRVISSPLQRCAEAAATLAQQCAIPLQLDERWIEIDYGQWENRPVDEVLREHADEAQKLWADPLNFCAPGGEAVSHFQQRLLQAWQSLLEQYAGEHLLLVCHGGVMRVLAQHLLALEPQAMNRLAIPYAGLMRYRIDHSDYQGEAKQWVTLESLDGSELIHPAAETEA